MLLLKSRRATGIHFRTLAITMFLVLFGMNLAPALGTEPQHRGITPDSIRTADCNLVINARSKNISITISSDDKLFWNLTPLPDFDTMLTKAKQISDLVPQPEVRLCADQQVKFQQIGRTLAMLQRAGVAKVSFVIQNQAVTLDLPINPNALFPRRQVAYFIDFDPDGAMSLNGSPISDFANAGSELTRISADPVRTRLLLNPNRLVAYKSVADVMVSAYQMGIKKIEFVGNAQYF